MRKLFTIIALVICLILPFTAEAITTYNCNGLTGGTQRDLDYVSVSVLNNGDRALVVTGTIKYHFKYDSTANNAENITTHPFKVRPDDFATAGVWIEQELADDSIDAAMIAASAVGTSEINDGTVATADLGTSAVTPIKVNVPGYVQRAKFTWTALSTTVYISDFIYDHQGTTEQLVYSDSSIRYVFGASGSNAHSTNLDGGDWFYLYIDDSAVITAATNLIAVAQLLAVTEEPVYSYTKHGHYGSVAAGNATATDRCIGAFRSSSGDSLLEFSHNNNLLLYPKRIADFPATDVDTTWTDATLTIPSFARAAEVTISLVYSDSGGATGAWRRNGQTAGTGHTVGTLVTNVSERMDNTLQVHTDSNLKIEVRLSASSNDTIAVSTEGWYFPEGM